MAELDTSQSGVSLNEDQTPKNKTQKTWKPKYKSDARKAQSAGTYPDYFSWKTRSGHVLQLDDTQGGETVTLQHRGGSAFQIAPDGSMTITAHNGKYEVTFGENRMTISGAQDITVKGDASMRVYGDYNVTCQKDYNLTVLGNFNLTAKNHNRHILGNMDTQARNENKKLMGSSSKIARGAIAYVAKGSSTFASQSDQVHIGGAAGVNLVANEGNITQNIEKGNFYSETKDGEVHVKSKGQMNYESTDDAMKFTSSKDFGIESQNNGIQVKAQQDIGLSSSGGNIQAKASDGNVEMTAQSKMDLRATGEASLSGSTTHVSGQTVNVSGSSTTNIDGPSALNLNGGLSQVMSALGLQLNFNFGQTQSETGTSRGVHAPNSPAGRDEADNWV
jgi:uncharacterized protein (DUF2345 family)